MKPFCVCVCVCVCSFPQLLWFSSPPNMEDLKTMKLDLKCQVINTKPRTGPVNLRLFPPLKYRVWWAWDFSIFSSVRIHIKSQSARALLFLKVSTYTNLQSLGKISIFSKNLGEIISEFKKGMSNEHAIGFNQLGIVGFICIYIYTYIYIHTILRKTL